MQVLKERASGTFGGIYTITLYDITVHVNCLSNTSGILCYIRMKAQLVDEGTKHINLKIQILRRHFSYYFRQIFH